MGIHGCAEDKETDDDPVVGAPERVGGKQHLCPKECESACKQLSACVRACVRECVRACVSACVRACVRA